MTVNKQYIGAAGVLPADVLPEGVRMMDVVLRCIAATQAAFDIDHNEIKNGRAVTATLARYMLTRLIAEHTKLSRAEIEQAMGMSKGSIWRLRKIFHGWSAPAVEVMYDYLNEMYLSMVRIEYDREIPF